MSKVLSTLIIAALFGTSLPARAEIVIPDPLPVAGAAIDLENLSWVLTDLDPFDGIAADITWGNPDSSFYSAGNAEASIDESLMSSIVWTQGSSTNAEASVWAWASFTLTPKTLAVFSVPALAGASGDSFAQAWLGASSEGGSSYQYMSDWIDARNNNIVDRTLSVGFMNLTTGEISGELQGGTYAYAPAVPEPETYAMMLAGIALMLPVARRRRT